MSIHTAEFMDMTRFLDAEDVPFDPTVKRPMIQRVIPLGPREIWRARMEPVDASKPDGPLAWSLVREGELVRIPMIPYRTAADLSSALLGAMDVIQRYTEAFPNAVRTHIVMGQPVEEITDQGTDYLRFWLGFATQIQ